MRIIVIVHSTLSNTVWLFFLILGVWGILRAMRKQGVDGSYLGALVIGQVLYMVQDALGGILWLNGRLSSVNKPEMHVLYGVFALAFMPFVYFVWLKEDDNSPQAQWVLAFTTLFLFGIALQAIAVGA